MENKLPETLPWKGATDPIWPVTYLLLKRNVKGYPFPDKLQKDKAKELVDRLTPFFSGLLPPLSPHEKEWLFEHFILHEGFEKHGQESAFAVNAEGNCLAMINLEDHLHVRKAVFNDLMEGWKELAKQEKEISEKVGFAFSQTFGYLTSDPTSCGTGLCVQAFLHIPALLHLEQFAALREAFPESITVKGLGAENTYIGDFVLLENTYSLGMSEEAILMLIGETAARVRDAERELRKTLDPKVHAPLNDKIARALGLLSHATTLQIQETLSALSLIHLGMSLGWIKKGEAFSFFDLFF